MTYSEAANLALNQTLVRSINTSIVALLPVASILVIGVGVLGAGTLKDLALALFVGTAVGAYSSIFIATPFLASIKELEPANQALAKRVAARRSGLEARRAVPVGSRGTGEAASAGADADEQVPADFDNGGATSATPTKGRPSAAPVRTNSPRTQPRKKRKR